MRMALNRHRRPPGRPPGSKNKPKRVPGMPLPLKRGRGRPAEVPERPDSPAKVVIQALGGVSRAVELLTAERMPYTKAALYLWLRAGYIPDRAFTFVLRICRQRKLPLPEAIEKWNWEWDPDEPTPCPLFDPDAALVAPKERRSWL